MDGIQFIAELTTRAGAPVAVERAEDRTGFTHHELATGRHISYGWRCGGCHQSARLAAGRPEGLAEAAARADARKHAVSCSRLLTPESRDRHHGSPHDHDRSTAEGDDDVSDRVDVKVLLLFGDQAEITADAADAEGVQRYPAADVATDAGVAVSQLPGMRLTALVGDDGRLSEFRTAE
ncbi:hypothetical protein [Streptomyces sp. NPDC051162]|uniref:hypothetical protein n=1 Tax=Streptomyces sp. NPDC051162 TaxID=3154747 RepID=UPI003414F8D6